MRAAVARTRSELERFARFCVVGVSNTLLTLVAFSALGHVGIAAAPASGLAFAVGAVNGYVLNRSWTFRSRRRGAATLARYVAVQALGAGFSAGGVALAAADLSLRRLVAEVVVLPFVTLLTYTLSRRVVFDGSALA
jgi:putative flippase GtrA